MVSVVIISAAIAYFSRLSGDFSFTPFLNYTQAQACQKSARLRCSDMRPIFLRSVVLLRRKIPPETQKKLLLWREICFAMSLMTKQTLVLTLTTTRKCYSISRSAIDENNDSVSKSWIVFRNGIVVKFTSAAEFSASEDLAFYEIVQARV